MSKTLTKEELIRASWLTELRRQGKRQCVGMGGWTNKVCALQLLADVAGVEPGLDGLYKIGLTDIAEGYAGLSNAQAWTVVAMNDGHPWRDIPVERRHTFAEIADTVEGWFKS